MAMVDDTATRVVGTRWPRLAAWIGSGRALTLLRRAIMLLSAVVPLWMLLTILGEDPFGRMDYLEMLGQIYKGDGSLRWRGFLEHQNEHLVLVPKLVIVANVVLFDGSRVTLGVFVWCVAAGLAVLLARAMRPLLQLSPWGRVVALWTLVLFAFPIAAQHNFRVAISGTAWTLANLLMVLAVVLAVRGRSLLAGATGAAATFTYGTGLAVWPALVVVLVVRRRFGVRDRIMLLIGVMSVAVERLTPLAGTPRPPVNRWPTTIIRNAAITIGELFSDGVELAAVLGVALALAAIVAVIALRSRPTEAMAALAIPLLVVPTVSLLLVSLGRSIFDGEAFGASRYMGVSALFALFTLFALVVAFGESRLLNAVAVGLLALSLFGSEATTRNLDVANQRARAESIAVYMGVGNGIVDFYDSVETVLPALGHVPFDGSFDADCGQWQQQIPAADIVGSVEGEAEPVTPSANDAALLISGWIDAPSVDCVLVIDGDRTVVGIANPGYPRENLIGRVSPFLLPGFEGFALVEHRTPLTVIARLGDSDTFATVATVPESSGESDEIDS